ncbi:MAG: hypothetical protein ABI461_04600 [Polyangiaceae bacterium]
MPLTGCGLLDKLRGTDAGSDAGDVDSGAVVDETDAAVDDDAAADAAVVVRAVGDNIPTFTADNAAAAKEISPANYKTEFVNLDKEVKALK